MSELSGAPRGVSPGSVLPEDGAEGTAPAAQWVTFRLGEERYAVPIEEVREVIRVPPIAPVPGAGPEVLGVVNLRGQLVAVLDLARMLGAGTDRDRRAEPWPPVPGEAPPCAERRILVLGGDGEPLGARVDQVGEVVEIEPWSVEGVPDARPPGCRADGPPVPAPRAGAFVAGVWSGEEAPLALLDVAALLGAALAKGGAPGPCPAGPPREGWDRGGEAQGADPGPGRAGRTGVAEVPDWTL